MVDPIGGAKDSPADDRIQERQIENKKAQEAARKKEEAAKKKPDDFGNPVDQFTPPNGNGAAQALVSSILGSVTG